MKVFAFIAMLFIASTMLFVQAPQVSAETAPKQTKAKKVIVTVKSGDSLSKIAKKHKSTYQRLFDANLKIKHPDMIHPGDKVRIPSKKEKLKRRSIPGVVSASVKSIKKSAPAPAVAANYASGSSVWDRLAACESGGNWAINTGNGYYGGLQFTLSSWRGVGGSGYPHQASRAEQIKRGEMLKASGGWGHWPACAAKLGLL